MMFGGSEGGEWSGSVAVVCWAADLACREPPDLQRNLVDLQPAGHSIVGVEQ